MCGIIGYVGAGRRRRSSSVACASSSIAATTRPASRCSNDGTSRVVRCRGKLAALEEKLREGAGARHGRHRPHAVGDPRPAVATRTAHPHKVGPISVIHNGIIENHLALRAELAASGAKFSSETDTEIFAHLVERAARDGRREPHDRGARARSRRCAAATRSS